jgi:hypothetical protein
VCRWPRGGEADGRGAPRGWSLVEKIAIIGLQTMWLLSNRIPNVGFVQIGLQTIFSSSNRIMVLLTIFRSPKHIYFFIMTTVPFLRSLSCVACTVACWPVGWPPWPWPPWPPGSLAAVAMATWLAGRWLSGHLPGCRGHGLHGRLAGWPPYPWPPWPLGWLAGRCGHGLHAQLVHNNNKLFIHNHNKNTRARI